MYQTKYKEFAGHAQEDLREGERAAIDRSIELLRRAKEMGVASRETVEAVFYLQSLWVYFIEELGKKENALAEDIRASLISIGLWLLRESEEIRLEKSRNFDGLIDVSATIRDALR
jgi:flagellar biosynthesis activator protein FlaF